jgi:hypothetical protein
LRPAATIGSARHGRPAISSACRTGRRRRPPGGFGGRSCRLKAQYSLGGLRDGVSRFNDDDLDFDFFAEPETVEVGMDVTHPCPSLQV